MLCLVRRIKVKILVASVVIVFAGCDNYKRKGVFDFFAGGDSIPVVTDTIMSSGIEDLVEIDKHYLLTDDQLYTDFDGGDQLASYFVIELIDEDTFEKNKALSVNLLNTDTVGIEKINGVLRLPMTKGYFELKDNAEDNEAHKEFTYIGQMDRLNAYLVYGVYWEDWNYLLIDKNKGTIIQTFANIPYLSADGKYIMTMDVDADAGAAYIDLYTVTDHRYVDPLIGMYAKNWVPETSIDKIFWCSDNYLYMPVVHNKDYWSADGNFKKLAQYIRLKPAVAA